MVSTEPKQPIQKTVFFTVNEENMLNINQAGIFKGTYEIKIEVIAFNESDTADAEFIIHGKSYDLTGKNLRRRDISRLSRFEIKL